MSIGNMQETQEKLSPRELLERYRYTGKLTPKLRVAVCEAVRNGTPARTALKAFGLYPSTITAWQQYAESGEKGTKYVEFARELETAWNEWVQHVALLGGKHVEKDGRVWYQTIAALLPEYSKKDTLDVNVEVSADAIFRMMAEAQQKVLTGSYRFLPESLEEPE